MAWFTSEQDPTRGVVYFIVLSPVSVISFPLNVHGNSKINKILQTALTPPSPPRHMRAMPDSPALMAGRPLISDLVDPLSELNGPLLFPRTVRVSVGESVPTDSGDLDSINEFMKSRALRSPQKLVTEAKKIVDSGTAILESNLVSFNKIVNASDAVSKKCKDIPRERRQGLGLARKREPFTLKTSLSQPVSMEPPLNLDKIQDPDEFFDAYERHEKAKKEMRKQLGSSMENANEFKPSTKPRLRRQGILGKSYSSRSRYSSMYFENDTLMSPQEVVEQHVPSVPGDEQAEKLFSLNSNLNIDSEEIESVASMSKKGIEACSLSDDLLSCDHEDLDGDGALNLLQGLLKIKPLDLQNLTIPELHDFQSNKFSVRESLQQPHKTSFVIDNVLKNAKWKQSIDREHTATKLVNPIASPTPPRSPFASLSFLKKRVLQSNPMRDAFSPQNVDLSVCKTTHPVESIDMVGLQVNATTVSRISSELESHVGVEVTGPADTNMDPQKVIGCSNNLPQQFIDEKSSIQGEKAGSGRTEVPDFNNIEEVINIENTQSNPSVLEDEATDASARIHNFDIEQQSKVCQTKFLRRKREADEELNRNEMRKRLAESGTPLETEVRRKKRIKVRPLEPGKGEKNISGHLNDDQSNLSVCEDEAAHAPSRDRQFDADGQLEVHQTELRRRKRETDNERLRKLHPLRKSLAESGTSFDNGVRRSKRIKMRPLEYWKGERFLYGRVNESMKLIGLKYISPGKDEAKLKVKPLILSKSSEYEDLLELAARH